MEEIERTVVPTWPRTPPASWGPDVAGPGSPLGSVRPPDVTGTYEVPPTPGRWRRLVAVAAAALLGAAIGTAATLTLAGPLTSVTVRTPVVEVSDGEGLSVVAAVAEAVSPSVVRVDLLDRVRDPLAPSRILTQPVGNGSGVIYRSDGYIITNNHVVAGGDLLQVRLASGETLDAEVVGTDPLNDLAVIKVDRQGLPAITVRTDPPVRVGEVAIAIGSPFGLDTTVTAGVISGTNRTLEVPDPQDPRRVLVIPNVLQTDAAINPGNSGGALVDASGRLIGINSAILSQSGGNEGVGFAIPAPEAVAVADELISQGFVRHAFLGISGADLSPTAAQRLGLDIPGGAVVEQVEPGTGAAAAGLQPDDIIIAVDGRPIESMTELVAIIRQHDPGDRLTLTVLRDGRRFEVTVELGERPR